MKAAKNIKLSVEGFEVAPEFVLMALVDMSGKVHAHLGGIYLIHVDDLRSFQKHYPAYAPIDMADYTSFWSHQMGKA